MTPRPMRDTDAKLATEFVTANAIKNLVVDTRRSVVCVVNDWSAILRAGHDVVLAAHENYYAATCEACGDAAYDA